MAPGKQETMALVALVLIRAAATDTHATSGKLDTDPSAIRWWCIDCVSSSGSEKDRLQSKRYASLDNWSNSRLGHAELIEATEFVVLTGMIYSFKREKYLVSASYF